MGNIDLSTYNLFCCGSASLIILVLILWSKRNQARQNERISKMRGRYKSYASSDVQSRGIGGNHVYTWREGDGENPGPGNQYQKSPYIRGSDEKGESWKDWMDRNGVKPFGTNYADAIDLENYVDKIHEDWNNAHPYSHPQTRPTNTDGSEDVIDTPKSSEGRKDWH